MTGNPGIYHTRGTVLLQDVDIIASLMNNILTLNGPGGGHTFTLTGTQLIILAKGVGVNNIILPKISSIGNNVIMVIMNASNLNPTYTVAANATDAGIVFPPPSIRVNPAGVGINQLGESITIMSDSSQNLWFLLSST